MLNFNLFFKLCIERIRAVVTGATEVSGAPDVCVPTGSVILVPSVAPVPAVPAVVATVGFEFEDCQAKVRLGLNILKVDDRHLHRS